MKIRQMGLGLFFLVSSLYAMEPERKKIKLVDDFEKTTLEDKLNEKFLDAIKQGDFEKTMNYLQEGADINARSYTGKTALIEAVLQNNVEIVKLLLEQKDPQVDVNARFCWCLSVGNTALMYAVDNPEILTLLLNDHRVNVTTVTNLGENVLIKAVQKVNIESIKLLLKDQRININAKENYFGGTALMFAAFDGRIDIVKLLLADPRINLNIKNNEGNTALIHAISKSHIEIVRLLLKHPQINIDIQNNNGSTPLMHAVVRGDITIVQLLLKAKADIKLVKRALPFAVALPRIEIAGLLLKAWGKQIQKFHTPELTEFIDSDIKSALTEINLLHSGSIGVLKELHLFARYHSREFPWLEKEINKLMNRVLALQTSEQKREAFKSMVRYQRAMH